MAEIIKDSLWEEYSNVKYSMIHRTLIRFIEHDIAIMPSWIERTGYGASLTKLKLLANDIGIQLTLFPKWIVNKKTD